MRANPTTIVTLTFTLSLCAFSVGCTDAVPGITEPQTASVHTPNAARSSASCQNVLVEGVAALGFIEIAPGVFTLGAIPISATIAGVQGLLGSVVTGLEPSGSRGQGAQHLTLTHTFTSTSSPAGSFTTTDRAVCAPAGKDALTCRVNDALTVAAGTGVFANAAGTLHNHGTINLSTWTVSVSLRGRVCGDGL